MPDEVACPQMDLDVTRQWHTARMLECCFADIGTWPTTGAPVA